MLPADGFRPTLSKLVDVLDRFHIRFHLTGGLTSVVYGEPRMTQDVDLVLDREQVMAVRDEFLDALATAGFHFSEALARQGIDSRRMIQLLDLDQIIKLDLYVRCLIPGELDRSVPTEVFPGVTLPLAARTDAALSKLVWIHRGNHRSRRDLRWMLRAATDDEVATVRRTAAEMDLQDLLDEVLDESDEVDP